MLPVRCTLIWSPRGRLPPWTKVFWGHLLSVDPLPHFLLRRFRPAFSCRSGVSAGSHPAWAPPKNERSTNTSDCRSGHAPTGPIARCIQCILSHEPSKHPNPPLAHRSCPKPAAAPSDDWSQLAAPHRFGPRTTNAASVVLHKRISARKPSATSPAQMRTGGRLAGSEEKSPPTEWLRPEPSEGAREMGPSCASTQPAGRPMRIQVRTFRSPGNIAAVGTAWIESDLPAQAVLVTRAHRVQSCRLVEVRMSSIAPSASKIRKTNEPSA